MTEVAVKLIRVQDSRSLACRENIILSSAGAILFYGVSAFHLLKRPSVTAQ